MSFFLITNEGASALKYGVENIQKDKAALDIIEGMIQYVEQDEMVHSVGISSWPNMLGEMEFDAAIIDGSSREAGAIGAIKHVYHPISVARKVMEKLPHVFLAGEGARIFADEHGFGRDIMLNEHSIKGYQSWRERNQLKQLPMDKLSTLAWDTADPQKAGGTIACLVQDSQKNLSAGVSTSGWAWKYPSRLGDSPVIGAGIYADSRYGAAGCIGHGEVAIRTVAAKSIVQHMEYGLSPEQACLKLADEIRQLPKKFISAITIHAVSMTGEHFAICLGDGVPYYYFWCDGMEKAEKFKPLFLPIEP